MRKISTWGRIKLQTHNPTLEISFTLMDLKLRVALLFAFASILINTFSPILIHNTTLFKLSNIWINICYSIVASVIFFYFNEHLKDFGQKIKSYNFETGKLRRLIEALRYPLLTMGIDEQLVNGPPFPKEVSYNQCGDLLDLDAQIESARPHDRQYEDWQAYYTNQVKAILSAIRDILTFHNSFDASILEIVRKIEYKCSIIDTSRQEDQFELRMRLYQIAQLHDELYELRELSNEQYKPLEPVQLFRNMVHDEKTDNDTPYAYRYEINRSPIPVNQKFVERLIVCGAVLALIFLAITYS